MKLIRTLLVIPACLIALGIVYWAFGLLLLWFIGLSKFWFIVVLIFFGGAIWGLFTAISAGLTMLTSMISPNKLFSFWTVVVLSVLFGGRAIYRAWTLDLEYSGKVIFGMIIYTILVLEITYVLIHGSAVAGEDNAFD